MKVLFCISVRPELKTVYTESLPEDLELVFPDELSEESLLRYASEIDIAVGYKFSREFMNRARKLIHIQVPWTGAEHLDYDLLNEKEFSHITVSNSHSNSLAIAEYAVALMISIAKNIVYRDSYMRKGDWTPRYNDVTSQWLTGKTCGIIGYGAIGRKVAHILREGFNMQIMAIKRDNPEVHSDETSFSGTMDSLDHVLKNSDYILIAFPLTHETKGLISEKQLNLLKENAVLVNVGRGKVIDEEDLYRFLKNKRMGGVGLDVWYNYPKDRKKPQDTYQNYPFEKLTFLVMSPHSAFKIENREIPFTKDIIENLIAIYKEKQPENQIHLDRGY
ncbi:MAG: 2-hydroxyacid dehydrogenase [Candidatus Hodarchaeales archaeon]